MNVVILFSENLHYGLAAASRVIHYAKGLQENGCNVKVLIPFGFVARQNITFQKVGLIDGVQYEYLQYLPFHPKRKYFFPIAILIFVLNKFLAHIRYFLRSNPDADIIYIYKFSNFQTLLLLLINRRKVVVSELCEIPNHNTKGIWKIIHRTIREKFVFPFFDGFVVISENLLQYIHRHKAKDVPLIKVPILTEPFEEENTVRKNVINCKEPFILHTGSLSDQKDGVTGMLEAFGKALPHLPYPVKFVITGFLESSPNKGKILSQIEKYNLKDAIEFVGFLDKDALKELQQKASLAILNKFANEQNFYCFPTKLAEYLMHQIPIISTNVGELNMYLRDDVNAFVVEPSNVEALSKKIIQVFTDDLKRIQVGVEGQRLATVEFNYKKHGVRLKDYFQTLLKKYRPVSN